jgi:hypothetical protein
LAYEANLGHLTHAIELSWLDPARLQSLLGGLSAALSLSPLASAVVRISIAHGLGISARCLTVVEVLSG